MQVVHNICNVVCFLSIIYAKYKDIKAIKVGMISLQFRLVFGFFQRAGILNTNDPMQEISVNTILFMAIVLTGNFVGFIFEQRRNTINIFTCVVLVIGLDQRIYGYDDIKKHLSGMIINSFMFMFALPLYMYCNQALVNISSR
jgi:hypothetical protein